MALYSIVGKLEVVGQPVPVQGKNGQFYKREVVLDCSWFGRDSGQKVENHPVFEFVGDSVNAPAQFQLGQKVTVTFVVQGNKSEKDGQVSYFNKLVGKGVYFYQPQYQHGGGQPNNYPPQGGYGQGFNPGYQQMPPQQAGYQQQPFPPQQPMAPQGAPQTAAPFPPQVDPATGMPVGQQDNADDLPF